MTLPSLRGKTIALGLVVAGSIVSSAHAQHSVARQWNELLLDSIRGDFARPTVHARNLYHISAAMYDAWATYDPTSQTVLFQEDHATTNPAVDAFREEALSYATYQLLKSRFAISPGFPTMSPQYDNLMTALGFSTTNNSTVGNSPSAVGNRIAQAIMLFGDADNSNEVGDYANLHYEPVNDPLVPSLPGNPDMSDPNRWQPLALQFFVDQSGHVIPFGYPEFLSPEWGAVTPFALSQHDLTVRERDGYDYWLYHDPGSPPQLGSPSSADYKWGNEMVVVWSSHLDPSDGVMIDASPNSIGNAPLPLLGEYSQFYDFENGGDWGPGYTANPVTGQPYPTQMVPRGDYGRVLAEFWADGPESETPPGHWYTILNYVSDHPSFTKQLGGSGPVLNDLEWDCKSYLALGGAMHDCAVASWGCKGWYDYTRPVSAIRYLADLGQCTDSALPSYHPDGINLHPGYIELVTPATTAAGQHHEHLAGAEGKIAVRAWRGPSYIGDPATTTADVGWILAENWWPYQRPTFVTPPFAGYVSGHSTYSRAAAVVMDQLTGSPYFPDGLGEFQCPQDAYLVFEDGPSQTVTLQWASYYDASDQCSLSRIWGGIHPPADDVPGRRMGQFIGEDSMALALQYFAGTAAPQASYSNYGFGCVGTNGSVTLSVAPDMMPVLGGTLGVDIANAPIFATNTFMVFGINTVNPGVDLTAIGMPTCLLSVNIMGVQNVPVQWGTGTWEIGMSTDPIFYGQSIYHQAFTPDPGANALGLTSSQAGDAIVGN